NARHVGDEDEQPRAQARGERARRAVAVDVEHLAVLLIQRGRRNDRHAAGLQQLLEECAVDERHAADETELRVLALRAEHAAVNAGQTDRGHAARDERRDDPRIRESRHRGERDIACRRIGDTQSPDEARLEAEPSRPLRRERTDAVHDDERVPRVVQRRDDVERRSLLTQDGTADLQHEEIAHVMYSALMRTYSADMSQPHAVASPSPRPRVTSISIASAANSARTSASATTSGAPLRYTNRSPMRTLALRSSTRAPERPAAASTRPQLGSPPWMAVRTRFELVMVRAARRASAAEAAPRTRTSNTFVAPSPSATIIRARSAHTARTPSSNAARSAPFGATPDAPFARTSSVSLVLVSPSTEIALKVVSAARETMRRRSPGSTAASVVTNASSVAMFGWIIPAPFATPPMRTVPAVRFSSRSATLGRVSVVMIARDVSSQPLSARTIPGSTAAIRSTGSLKPITPVLATATSYGEQLRTAAAASAIAIASRSPCSPVQAFALPEFTTIARSGPRSTWRRLTTHGAAMTWLVVNTAAAVQGRSETMSATSKRSGRPYFTPAFAAPARKPCA